MTDRPAGSDVFAEVASAQAIASRVAELGRRISEDYEGRTPVLLGVLSGSLMFHADLVRNITVANETDFLALTRFGEGGRVRLAMDAAANLEGRHVLIVEDIVDTGFTLSLLIRTLQTRNCAEVRTAALLDKVPRRIVDVPIDYRGFEVGDEFLLGYGLDWEGMFRNLPSLWAVMDFARFIENPAALFEVAYANV